MLKKIKNFFNKTKDKVENEAEKADKKLKELNGDMKESGKNIAKNLGKTRL
jgi:F0F1-type ATP synthase membrane subunit b/b'